MVLEDVCVKKRATAWEREGRQVPPQRGDSVLVRRAYRSAASPPNAAPSLPNTGTVPSLNGLSPTLPAAPRKDQYVSYSELEDIRRCRRAPPDMLLRTDGCLCIRTFLAGFLCVSMPGMPLDCKRAAHTTFMCFDKRDIGHSHRLGTSPGDAGVLVFITKE
jgi:hypothetical protein